MRRWQIGEEVIYRGVPEIERLNFGEIYTIVSVDYSNNVLLDLGYIKWWVSGYSVEEIKNTEITSHMPGWF